MNQKNIFKYCLEKYKNFSNSQKNQDLFVFFETGMIQDGFFVEMGAYDGMGLSNTLVLETVGWDGLLCEPNPKLFKRCKKNRKVFVDNRAVFKSTEEKM